MARRPNPLKQRGPKFKPPRSRRASFITVYAVVCHACKQKYELLPLGNQRPEELKFCIFCKSQNTELTVKQRRETKADRQERDRRFNLNAMRIVGGFLGQLFGFNTDPRFVPPPPNGFTQPRNGSKPSGLEAEMLKEGYKKMAMKYHPDKGGDPEKMKELNRLKEKLGL